MRTLMIVAAFLSFAACNEVAVAPVAVATAASTDTIPSNAVQSSAGFTTQINAFRASQGMGPLRQSAELARAAQAHADDMVARAYFSHQSAGGPNGSNLLERAQSAGCNPRAVAENIAEGQKSEAEVLDGWANSS